ncbi:MAG: [protein-PII] uridylyltransferase, partial [Burkholderiaceae bacterium]
MSSPMPQPLPADPPNAQPLTLAAEAVAIRATLESDSQRLLEEFDQTGRSQRLLKGLATAHDVALRACWKLKAMPVSAALIAVGGYGRGEHYPYSDVDVLILLAAPASEPEAAAVESLIGMLWDLGFEVGHSVRTIPECLTEAERDVTVATALLEARPVAGDRGLCTALLTQLTSVVEPQHFFRAKMLEQQQRYAKFQDTPYALEPNIKESPGGLRDLQMILWTARAAGFGTSWSGLEARKLVTPVETRQLRRCESFLQRLRIRLHRVAHRREDRLVFDLQTALAAEFGFEQTATRRASEVLMQRYYRTAKGTTQLNVIVLQKIEAALFPQRQLAPIPIDACFVNAGGLLDIVDDGVFIRRPSALLEAFLVMQKHSEIEGMTARLMNAIWHGRTLMDVKFRRDPANRALFLSILQQPRGIVHALRRMNQLSVLGRYLPVFRRIVGQMQHDLYHVYTVDQHIMMVVRNLRRFMMPEFAHEYPLCSRLIANFERPWLMYVAALFHDIAKGRGGDHSRLGMGDVRRFARDHAIEARDIELLVFLVEHHLTMSRVAQKEDWSDPEVLGDFARVVRDERRLTALYLLTVADVRGTSPKVWNAWKGKLLEDLYFRALRIVADRDGVGGPPSAPAELEARQEEARRILGLYAFDSGAIDRFWKRLDVAWFLRHDAQDIAWITRAFALARDNARPKVKARLSPAGEGLQIVVFTLDQPDLLARICQYFDRQRFFIVDARVHTTLGNEGERHALDSFHVLDPDGSHYRDRIANIERDLAQHMAYAAPLPLAATGRPSRQSRSFPIAPTVDLRPDERGRFFLLTLSTSDRDGLLYAILRILASHRVNVQAA